MSIKQTRTKTNSRFHWKFKICQIQLWQSAYRRSEWYRSFIHENKSVWTFIGNFTVIVASGDLSIRDRHFSKTTSTKKKPLNVPWLFPQQIFQTNLAPRDMPSHISMLQCYHQHLLPTFCASPGKLIIIRKTSILVFGSLQVSYMNGKLCCSSAGRWLDGLKLW